MAVCAEQVQAHAHALATALGLNDYNSYARAALAASLDTTRAVEGMLRRINTEFGKPGADAILTTFCAHHLHKLFAAYKATHDDRPVTCYTTVIASVMDKGVFVRFTRTPQGRELFRIQLRRFAGRGLPRLVDDIRNMAHLFNFFAVHAFYDQNMTGPCIESAERHALLMKADAYRRYCFDQMQKMQDPSAKATFAILTETVDFLKGVQSPAKMLGAFGATMPLHVCGDIDSQCFSTGVRATLHCTNCESVRYCGPVHQRSHWVAEHRSQCVRPVWL
ncbi:hypothetical protein BKA62DRAFT_427805 [Auriculariales sp. MPI-PUGE-AT-0066]|nr:hypothetical protein BKA62DRAFT_427805 [Auriculariales sp. MPI-PUGE-AT-0066]